MADLDAFLTQLELKLKSPFSSLELAKTVVDTSTFLQQLGQVLPRADKITQLRSILGLLGFDDDPSQHAAAEEESSTIATLLHDTAAQVQQDDSTYEEWVQVLGGLVQGLLPPRPHDEDDDEEDERGGMGAKAYKLLGRTCEAVLNEVESVMNDSNSTEEDNNRIRSDADPLLAPYRYALISRPLLEKALPRIFDHHGHFTVRKDAEAASILEYDAKIEAQKIQEGSGGMDGAAAKRPAAKSGPANDRKIPATPQKVEFPGFRSKHAARTAPPKKKASMFITSSRPKKLTTTPVRKAGAATKLVGRNRHQFKASAKVSRMKMMDDEKEVTEKLVASVVDDKKKASSSKTSSFAAATTKPVKKRPRDNADTESAAAAKKSKESNASATALAAYQAAQQQQQPDPAPAPRVQQDWRQLLAAKHNRLAPQDRKRIEEFFERRTAPAQGETVTRIKLHEERKKEDGKDIKETYYLELNYENWTSKQSKKIKRYDNK